MVERGKVKDLFDPTPDGKIKLAEDVPSPIRNAIDSANDSLGFADEWVIRTVGEPRRSIDFGQGKIIPIKTKQATIFAVEIEDGMKILAVAVSQTGPLDKSQIKEVFLEFGRTADLTPEEKVDSDQVAESLRSIKQTKEFVIKNSQNLRDDINKIKILLESPEENERDIYKRCDMAELSLHNMLSSVYTYIETINTSLSTLDYLGELKHYIQHYEDDVSASIGLRHCIQHNITLQIQWQASYSAQKNHFEYTLGIPLHQVNREEFYKGNKHDASGEEYEPCDYYYQSENSFLIDIEELSKKVEERTEDLYQDIKSELSDKEIEAAELQRRYMAVQSMTER